MPPKFKFTREEMISAALDIVRKKGVSGLTARSLAARLGCSVKPIFGLFRNMEELQQEVRKAANKLYLNSQKELMTSGKYPPYKASGMSYIIFAKEERELFKMLFMRDRTHEPMADASDEIAPLIELICKYNGISEENARLLHIEMWVCVHGIATMLATLYLDWDMEFASNMLTDCYQGLRERFIAKEKKGNGCN